MSKKYVLDSKDLKVLERLNVGLGIYDNVSIARRRKLVRWGYAEKRARGDYPLTQKGILVLELGPDELRWLSEQDKWTKIPDEGHPPALHQLAELEARIGPRRTLYRGTIIDPPGLPPLVRFILGLSAAKGAHNFIKKEDEDPFVASVAAFIVLYLVCVEA